jgi:hypothetical protein
MNKAMRFLALGCLVICIGCSSEPHAQSAQTQAVEADSGGAVVSAHDTIGSGFTADSILDSLSRRTPDDEGSPFDVVTRRGDTLGVKGGWGLGSAAIVELYSWNGTSFIRIKRSTSRAPDGYPQWSTLMRRPIPPVDSGQSVLVKCQVNNMDDPYVFGTMLTAAHPSALAHAWRFDSTSMKLSEIESRSVKCLQELGLGD